MNFNRYKLSLMFLVLGTGYVRAEYEQLSMHEEQPSTVDIQAQMSAMMTHVYELFMPEYKQLYKKYYYDIEWLEHNYVVNREQGNILLNTIAYEFQNVFINKLDEVIEVIAVQTNSNPTEQEREAFKNVMIQILPLTMVQGLMKNAELKSSVYQEMMTEQK